MRFIPLLHVTLIHHIHQLQISVFLLSTAGTHGHMKCYFDGQLKSQDTVLLHLYKRMYPKWTLDPFVPRPPPLYTFHTAHHSDSEDEEEGEGRKAEEGQQPASKKSKMVKFFSWGQNRFILFWNLFIIQWKCRWREGRGRKSKNQPARPARGLNSSLETDIKNC